MDTVQLLGREYVPRVIDSRLDHLLSISGAVVIEGPRACGKTMSGARAASSAVFLDSEDSQTVMSVDPQLLLHGPTPRLIDEWQLYPSIWNLVRRAVDGQAEDGQFILTGSSVPADDETRHTGAGRFLRIRQRTMGWFERGLTSDAVSLGGLFAGEKVETNLDKPAIDLVVESLCVSGFPAHIHRNPAETFEQMVAYATEISRADIKAIADIRHDPEVIMQLLRSLARATAAEVTIKTLATDLRVIAPDIREETVSKYLGLLQRLFVVEAINPWVGRLRSKANLRKSNKFLLADPALAVGVLGANPDQLKGDLETTGLIFESAVLHDLAIMVESLGGRLRHFRDSNGNEIDAILELPDGKWAAVEVKLGGGVAQQAADKLSRVAGQIEASRPPSFLAVITGTGMSLTFANGVHTFPLAALSP